MPSCQAAIVCEERKATCWYKRGESCATLGRHEDALDAFIQAHSRKQIPKLRLKMAEEYLALRRPAEVLEQCARFEQETSIPADDEAAAVVELRQMAKALLPPRLLSQERPARPRWRTALGWTAISLGIGALGAGVGLLLIDHKCRDLSDPPCRVGLSQWNNTVGGWGFVTTGVVLQVAGVLTLTLPTGKRTGLALNQKAEDR